MHPAGLLIVGHGTRDPRGVEEFLTLVDLVRRRMPRWPIEPGFLEFAAPTISVGFNRLIGRGISEVTVVPLLLFAAGHVRHDIPGAVAEAAVDHPGVWVRQASHLGCHPHIVELSTQRYEEALAGRPTIPPRETQLLLVGRGSRDRWATEEMFQFAGLRQINARGGRVETCFAALAPPSLAEALARVGQQPIRQVVVQPHLLFHGHLIHAIQAAVDESRRRHPGLDWIVTEPLGVDQLLAQTVEEIVAGSTARFELASLGPRRSG